MKSSKREKIWRVAGVAYFGFFLCMHTEVTAYAYVDPATTAMLTQIIAGIFITAGVVFGVFRRKIIMFFKNLRIKRVKRKIEKRTAGIGKDV